MKKGWSYRTSKRPKWKQRSLADIVLNKSNSQPFALMSIQVRDNDGPVVEAKFVWELLRRRR
jgi:hypothetical protein